MGLKEHQNANIEEDGVNCSGTYTPLNPLGSYDNAGPWQGTGAVVSSNQSV